MRGTASWSVRVHQPTRLPVGPPVRPVSVVSGGAVSLRSWSVVSWRGVSRWGGAGRGQIELPVGLGRAYGRAVGKPTARPDCTARLLGACCGRWLVTRELLQQLLARLGAVGGPVGVGRNSTAGDLGGADAHRGTPSPGSFVLDGDVRG